MGRKTMTEKTEKIKMKKEIISLMVKLYCQKKHTDKILCPQCKDLLNYCFERLESCPEKLDNFFCNNCQINCFAQKQQDEIRKVMRFAGPRMLFYHPPLVVKFLLSKLPGT